MFWYLLKHTLRTFKRERLHSSIAMLGLTIGLACGIIVALFVSTELSYESYHDKADRIYRVSQNFVTSGKPKKFSWTSPSLGPKLYQEFPQIETFTRLKRVGRALVQHGDIRMYENNMAFADTNFFEVFTHRFLVGDPHTCLQRPENIVLTEDLWHKYFGDEYPVGKTLMLENEYPVTVSAVIENLPANTHFYHNAYISYLAWDMISPLPSLDWSLFEINDHTFLLFRNDFDREQFYAGWPDFYKKYVEEDARLYGQVYEPIFQRIEDIHYHSDLPTNYVLGNWGFFFTVVSVGIFLLLLAGINYTNLAMARSIQRFRAISIQKVLGAGNAGLLIKVLFESLSMSFICLILAFGLVEYLLEFTGFAGLLGIRVNHNIINNGTVLLESFAVAVGVGVLSGLYPAIQYARFPVIRGLHGLVSASPAGGWTIRRALVVFQLILAVVAITFTVLMRTQISFLEETDLGFARENVILIPSRDSITDANIPFLQDELRSMAQVVDVSSACSYPGSPSGGLYTFEGDSGMEEHNLPVLFVDYNYLNTLGIELVAGRDFNSANQSEQVHAIIINQALARYMDWEEPLGKMIKQGRSLDATVTGVVRDFNFRSLHHPLEPLMIRLQGGPGCNLIVRTNGQGTGEVLEYLEARFSELVPERPFEYSFLEDRINSQYIRDEKHLSSISIFSGLCIFIACLGLFTLVSYTAERRTKEVGIRKVNGAMTRQVISLFIKDFLWLSLIAILISVPLIVWLFRIWLREFSYQTRLRLDVFIVTFAGVILATILTVLYHSVKAGRSNPVHSLRYE